MKRRFTSRMRGAFAGTILLLAPAAVADDKPVTAIKVDQVGYLSSAAKIAFVSEPGRTFSLKRASDGQAVFEGNLGAVRKDIETGDSVQAADFSDVSAAGEYYIDVPGVGRSWTFSIGPDVYSRAYYLAMRAFYGQRCGTAVDLGPEFRGYSHPACHVSGRFHPSSGKSGEYGSAGGWHDAGDYGRYLPSSAITVGTLMWAWEFYEPKLKSISLKIPESGNGIPDILNETRWNLEWMLKMQDADGGVWHKQTSEKFPDFISPDKDDAPIFVIGTGRPPYKSTCATADLAAAAAIAARVYKPFDTAFAQRSLDAARKAWAWTEKNPDVIFKNPPGVVTGEYHDAQCSDEQLWAAAELWRSTGEPAFNRYFIANYSKHLGNIPSPPPENWADMSPFAIWTYLLAQRHDADPRVLTELRGRVANAAKEVARRTQDDPYRVSMSARDYVWGSNGNTAQYGVQLLVANKLSPDVALVQAAADNLHYLFGRNAFSLSFVTGVGANPVRYPHHRPSGADKNAEPWPGLLSGGPNANRDDPVLKQLPGDLPPARVFADEQDSYASNEIAINWQAMLVFLLAGQLN